MFLHDSYVSDVCMHGAAVRSPLARGLVVGIVGFLAGCAAPVWEHSTKGMAAFDDDQAQCAQQAVKEEEAIDPHTGASIPLHERVRECLHARGYTERPR
jgi:hypothetical protein